MSHYFGLGDSLTCAESESVCRRKRGREKGQSRSPGTWCAVGGPCDVLNALQGWVCDFVHFGLVFLSQPNGDCCLGSVAV